MIGFEELGNKDDFSSAVLEFRLKSCGKPVFSDYATKLIRQVSCRIS